MKDERPGHLELLIAPDLTSVAVAAESVTHFLRDGGIGDMTVSAVSLAVEELAVNTIEHGSAPGHTPTIRLTVDLAPGAIVLVIEDDGQPFDPNDAPAPQLDVPLAERPIGGLGLHLVRSMSRRLEYQRRDDRNIVTLEFGSDPGGPPGVEE